MTVGGSGVVRVPDSELEYDSDIVYFHNGAAFTGVAYEEDPDRGRSEISYLEGMQHGPARDWYSSGKLKAESYYHENVRHGMDREFDEDGNLTSESKFEYGILVYKIKKDAEGCVVESRQLDEDSSNYRRLERYRAAKRWPRLT